MRSELLCKVRQEAPPNPPRIRYSPVAPNSKFPIGTTIADTEDDSDLIPRWRPCYEYLLKRSVLAFCQTSIDVDILTVLFCLAFNSVKNTADSSHYIDYIALQT